MNTSALGSDAALNQFNQSGSLSNIMNGRIDDVSANVNKQIKNLEDQLVIGFDMLQMYKEEAD